MTDNHGITLQGVLTMDDHCLDNTSIAYNSTIIFFKKAAKHKNVEVSNDMGWEQINSGGSLHVAGSYRRSVL